MNGSSIRTAALLALAATALACGRKEQRAVVVADPGPAIVREGVLVLSGDASLADSALRSTFLQYNADQRATVLEDERPAVHGGLAVLEVAPPEFSPAAASRAAVGLDAVDGAVAAIQGGGGAWLGDSAGDDDMLELLGSSRDLARVLAEHRAAGFAIGGGDRAACWMGERIVVDIPSEEAVAAGFPHELARGSRWAKEFIVHSGTLERGTLGALVMAMAETKVPFGLGLSAGSGVVFDTASERMKVSGDEPVVLVDLRGAKVRGASRSVENARISMLCPGDSYSLKDGQVRFIAGKTRAGGPPLGTVAIADGTIWSGETLRRAFATLATANAGSFLGESRHGTTMHRVAYTADSSTKSFDALAPELVPDHLQATVLNLRLDIMPAVH